VFSTYFPFRIDIPDIPKPDLGVGDPYGPALPTNSYATLEEVEIAVKDYTLRNSYSLIIKEYYPPKAPK
jgi:hypothetical protein